VSARGAWTRAAVVAVAVVALDQWTKHLVDRSIAIGDTRHVLPGLKLVHSSNEGVAFGILPHAPGAVIAFIAVALAALLYYFSRRLSTPLVWLPTGLLIGGALGNIIDRARHGSVTDFIKLPYWPAFNLADTAITLGVLSLLLIIEHARTAEREPA
jgi:signal peptidase II